jgi:hypothetical protein
LQSRFSHEYLITGTPGTGSYISLVKSKLVIGSSEAAISETNFTFTLNADGEWTRTDGVMLTVTVNVGNHTPTATSELKIGNVTYSSSASSSFSVVVGTPPPPPGT